MRHQLVTISILCLLLNSAIGQVPPESDVRVSRMSPEKLVCEHLPNAIRVHSDVISGGLPEGDAAFAELAAMGVKTIISVDGAKPNVEAARMHGLRYVHLPHGYDGIPPDRVLELAKAVRDLETPIYVHCHHGKHRSPTATVVACVSAGLIPSAQAIPVLKLAGTDQNYRGLYQAASQAIAMDPQELDSLHVDYQAVMEIPALTEAMVALGNTHDHLLQLASSAWKTSSTHPDLDSVHEALLLQEQFTELLRTVDATKYPPDFHRMLSQSEASAESLKHSLVQFRSSRSDENLMAIQKASKQIAENCKSCHQQYRDVPRTEKLPR